MPVHHNMEMLNSKQNCIQTYIYPLSFRRMMYAYNRVTNSDCMITKCIDTLVGIYETFIELSCMQIL